ncbi:MAG: alpha/beta hydrolase [Thermomicrobiales bacterium]
MSQSIRILFREDFYDGQFSRTLTAAYAGMADLGEAFATAHTIGKPTPDAWHEAWHRLASTTMASLAVAEAAGHTESVRSLGLRASEYFRQSYFFLRHDLSDSRLLAGYHGQVAAFAKALPLTAPFAAQFSIPYETTTIKGYFFSADAGPVARPTIVFPSGYDSTAEEGWNYAPAALARGYNVVSFEGPGQGGTLYEQGLFFRPDFNAVLTPLIDLLEMNPRVDNDAIVLIGRSFGGYLAPQAATVEHRLAALVCDPGQPDMAALLPKGVAAKAAAPMIATEMHLDPNKREFFGARMASHGVHTPEAYFAELHRYTMIDKARDIACPTLVIACEGDPVGGNGSSLASAMGDRATLKTLTIAEGAGGHCGWLGQRVWEDVVYGWLQDTLARAH